MKVVISCSTKFWAFALAEQLEKHGVLHKFYTSYSTKKNPILSRFNSRLDTEIINPKRIITFPVIAIGLKFFGFSNFWNSIFDLWVSFKIRKLNADVFIGWSGMSLRSITVAKKQGLCVFLERGSAHISYQYEILSQEFRNFDIRFNDNPWIQAREIKEYQACDFIMLPSSFAKKTFVKKGVDSSKLIINHYGTSVDFGQKNKSTKFTIVYLGMLMHRKGINYLLEAINQLDINIENYNVWLIGKVTDEVKEVIQKYKRDNWKVWGHIPQNHLPNILSQCSVGVVPSIEDGFGMVVPQLLSCGVPVIVTENTGASDIIVDGNNGYVIPVRSTAIIVNKIRDLYKNPKKLSEMTEYIQSNPIDLSWDAYGERYVDFLSKNV